MKSTPAKIISDRKDRIKKEHEIRRRFSRRIDEDSDEDSCIDPEVVEISHMAEIIKREDEY